MRARGGDLGPAGRPGGQQGVAVRAEPGLQVGDEGERLRGQDLLAPLDGRALHTHVRHCDALPICRLGWHPLTVARLDDFNDEPADRAAEALRACNAAPRFAAEVVAGRPYPDADTLVARAEEVARSLSWDEVVDRAGRPSRGSATGRRARRPRREASRREQSSMSDADAATRAALVEGNRAYEERFGHVFLIRAAGRSPEEMLAELRRRLANDADGRAGRGDRAAGADHRVCG